MDDQNLLNPSRRSFRDRRETGAMRLMKCKNPVIYSTFNVRTLSSTSRYEELIHCAKKHHIDVLSIQEHRLYHPDTEIQYKTTTDGYQLITISAWKNGIGSTVGGVGSLLSPRASGSLCKVENISPCIIFADFCGNPIATVISCYSPTNVSADADVTKFYHELKDATESIPVRNVLTVAGYFNAQIGPEEAAFTLNHATNFNGELLVEYAKEFQLIVANNNFMKPAAKLWTFQHPSGSRSQTDYILIRKKWINSIRNCQSYSSFCSIGSNHRIVFCHTCLSLRCSKKPVANPLKTIENLSPLMQTLIISFFIDVRNRYSALSQPEDDVETIYNSITKCTEEVALKTLPTKRKRKSVTLSAHALVKEARKAVCAARNQHQNQPTSQRNVNKAQRKLDKAYAMLKRNSSKAK